MLKKDEIYSVKIESMSNQGYGVCRINGFVTFVHGGVTGDICDVKIIKAAKSYAVARAVNFTLVSQFRREPDCLVKGCGGCVFQNVSFDYELMTKRDYVVGAMMKEGVDISVSQVATDGKFTRYRNKAQFPVTVDREGKMRAGFFAEKTHRVVPTSDCAITDKRFSEIANYICTLCDKYSVSAYNEVTGKGLLRHIYLRSGISGVLLVLVINAHSFNKADIFASETMKKFPCVTGVLLNINTENTNVILGDEYITVRGSDYIEDELLGKIFRISAQSFYQVNRSVCEMLYAKAGKLLDAQKDETVVDLYCGIGTVGLTVASNAGKLIGVEIVEKAIENARENAKLQGCENAEFYASDAADVLKYTSGRYPDSVIVDPPRKGLSIEVIENIVSLKPKKVVYISCDPATLARDLKLFRAKGYTGDTVYPFNMFPRTAHVESVVCLMRSDKAT